MIKSILDKIKIPVSIELILVSTKNKQYLKIPKKCFLDSKKDIEELKKLNKIFKTLNVKFV